MAELTAALGGRLMRIEHIGSTAVPGLAAKPVIDLMAATADLESVAKAEPMLTALGYRLIETGCSAGAKPSRSGIASMW